LQWPIAALAQKVAAEQVSRQSPTIELLHSRCSRIVVPTRCFAVAEAFLGKGCVQSKARDAGAGTVTIDRRRKGCVLQVGHLERFNPAIQAASKVQHPRFIESHRLAPFKQRGTDVSVVLDLMIHDIDLIQELVGRPIVSIDAVGSQVFSQDIDIANARIRFEGGCVVNTTASRVSLKQERKLRIFQDDAYLSVDLQQKILTIVRKKEAGPIESPAQVAIDEQSFEQGDALRSEIEAFLDAVRTGSQPVVTGEDGFRALATAIKITESVSQH
jgi:predicted dehydrogenase